MHAGLIILTSLLVMVVQVRYYHNSRDYSTGLSVRFQVAGYMQVVRRELNSYGSTVLLALFSFSFIMIVDGGLLNENAEGIAGGPYLTLCLEHFCL